MSVENLKTYPFVQEGLESGNLTVLGGYYDFVQGKFDAWTDWDKYIWIIQISINSIYIAIISCPF